MAEYNKNEVCELLKLCGYEDQDEIGRDTTRLIAVMPRALITPEDVSKAISGMKQLYQEDLELKSLRKMLGMWLKRFITMMNCRNEYKKVIYAIHPAEPRVSLTAALFSEDIYCDFPDLVFFIVQTQIFGNLSRYLDLGEQHGLPSDKAHCGINVLTAALLGEGIIPKPDLMMTAAYQCDQGHKVVEMFSKIHGIPFIKLDLVTDDPWGEFPKVNDRAVRYFAQSYDKLMKQVEEFLGATFTDELHRKTRHSYGKHWRLMDQINQLYLHADPCPARFVSRFPFSFFIIEPARIGCEEGAAVLELYLEEIKERIDKGYGVIEKGAPRIALLGGLGDDASQIGSLLEDCGVNPVVSFSATWLARYEKLPLPEQYKTAPISQKVAYAYLKRGFIRNTDGHVYRLKDIVEETGVDGLILSYPYQCRVFAAVPFMAKETIEKETGVPCMILEVGTYDCRQYPAGSLKTKIETFGDILRVRKPVSTDIS